MINKRVNGFTIMELTVTMLLSALIIGITYTSYQIISNGYSGFNHKNSDMASILRLDELLQKDFNNNEQITYADKQLTFKDSLRLTKYRFEADNIIRFSTITDTFKIEGSTIMPMFEKNIIITDSNDAAAQQVIDAVRISVIFKQDTINYYYTRNYGSQNLIKATTNANN